MHNYSITIICKQCSKSFKVPPYRQAKAQFCCYDCRRSWNEAQGTRPIKHTCEQCGKEFKTHKSAERLYCSRSCYWKSKEIKEQRKCLICSKVFEVWPSEPNRFCSRTCRDVWQRDPDERTCKQCGKTFIVHRHRTNIYCSQSCAAKANMLSRKVVYPVHVCVKCGKEFEYKRRDTGGKFCSRSCSDSANKFMAPGPSNLTCYVSSLETRMQAAMEDAGLQPIPQYVIGPYIADFVFPEQRLVIECDGSYWHGTDQQKAKDRQKDGYLKHHGWRVLRLPEHRILSNINECVQEVKHNIA